MNENDFIDRNITLRFLRKLCPNELYEGIEGDLVERYEAELKAVGRKRARVRFFFLALKFIRPGIILRNKFSIQFTTLMMLNNYFVIAWRNLLKNKTFSAINIIGLAIGLAACLFIVQFVAFELSFDSFNERLGRTYRVTNDRFQNGKLIQHGTIMYPTIGATMAKDFPEIEEHTRLMPGGEMNIKVSDQVFRGDECIFTDEHFLSVFSYPL